MRPQIVKILTLVLLVFNSISTFAQKASPPPPANNRGPQLPIDDSILVLIVLGLFYGVFIAYKKAHSKNTPS